MTEQGTTPYPPADIEETKRSQRVEYGLIARANNSQLRFDEDGSSQMQSKLADFTRRIFQEYETDPFRLDLPLSNARRILRHTESLRRRDIRNSAAAAIAFACELLLIDLAQRSLRRSPEGGVRNLLLSHICAAVSEDSLFDFLFDVLPMKQFVQSNNNEGCRAQTMEANELDEVEAQDDEKIAPTQQAKPEKAARPVASVPNTVVRPESHVMAHPESSPTPKPKDPAKSAKISSKSTKKRGASSPPSAGKTKKVARGGKRRRRAPAPDLAEGEVFALGPREWSAIQGRGKDRRVSHLPARYAGTSWSSIKYVRPPRSAQRGEDLTVKVAENSAVAASRGASESATNT